MSYEIACPPGLEHAVAGGLRSGAQYSPDWGESEGSRRSIPLARPLTRDDGGKARNDVGVGLRSRYKVS
ncbi:MAG TPA: hypothetical protein PK904_04620 [Bacteroidales bacterium]|nr:hypothetical protein [Bacteroidales bacterium]